MNNFFGNFLSQLRVKLARFMAGRNGQDEIVSVLLWAWPIAYVLSLLFRSTLLMLVADAGIIYMFFRMLSRNIPKRQAECAAFRQATAPLRKRVGEYIAMFKNRRKYAYFTCPKCKAKLRVPRGVGSVTVTCRTCGERFEKKA